MSKQNTSSSNSDFSNSKLPSPGSSNTTQSSSKKNNPAASNYKSLFKTEKTFYLADKLFEDGEVSEKMQKIIFRDLKKIEEIDRAVVEENSDIQINTVKVSLVFYKKGDLENSFTEERISPPDFGNPDFRRSAKNEILKNEKEFSKNYINNLHERTESELSLIESSTWNQFRIEENQIKQEQKTFKSDIKNLTNYLNQQTKLSSDNSENTSISPYTKYKFLSDEEAEECLAKLKSAKLIEGDFSLQSLNLDVLKNISNKLIEKINSKKEEVELLATESFEDFEKREKFLKDQQKKCQSILGNSIKSKDSKEPEATLEEVIKLLRGHSEDYLDYYIKNSEIIKEITADIKDADRFYLVITSSRKACERCSHIVEEISEMVNKIIQSSENSKPLKLLYASPEPFLENEKICEEDKNLSDTEFDETKVINVRRQPVYAKLCNKADEILNDNNSKKFSTPERKGEVNSNITSPGFSNLPLTQTPEGSRSVFEKIKNSTSSKKGGVGQPEQSPTTPESLLSLFNKIDDEEKTPTTNPKNPEINLKKAGKER